MAKSNEDLAYEMRRSRRSKRWASVGRGVSSFGRSSAGVLGSGVSFNWLILGLIAWYMYSKGKKRGQIIAQGQSFDPNSVDADVYSITLDQAKGFADDFLTAFNDVSWGVPTTDLETFENVLRNINAYDLGLIHHQFGKPSYGLTGQNEIWGKKLDLIGWIDKEISGSHPVYIKFQHLYKQIGMVL